MHIFYEPEILDTHQLNEEESKHCIKVLRHKKGDSIYVINGKGVKAQCIISDPSPKACLVNIEATENAPPENTNCHIAIAPTKSIDRFEWFLEKSTELGIATITPLLCQQSERKQIKPQRLERIITAATKQSKRLWRPVLKEMVPFKDFIHRPMYEKLKYIAHCEESNRKELFEELLKNKQKKDILILIGPEGDFSEEEIKSALHEGFIPVSMGKNRLRTETAGIAACLSTQLANSQIHK